MIIASPQVNRVFSNTPHDDVDVWIRVNNQDSPNSSARVTIHDINTTDVIVSQGVYPLKSGDKVKVRINVACNERSRGKGQYGHPNVNQAGTNAITPHEGPTIPAVIFTLYRI
jgi:hypothetical protein